ncbi:uncharacterized protein J4E88_007004 [Alternaria novae-zelandiae]|uniref:uncharacterized protein n=1 Tax=Alternaria novae-zelandiae TaxID=430562 RepID=UPI0020C1DDA5|nr:uncharacterized protein J4E88_007004 [Alternaria novae-zelandiae]KAI4677196.1 hypothetical protein J4E88_007004 [Alternaria novae-zelandiae]
MSDKDIEPCGVWDGDFSWDGYFMRMHMKTVTQTYDMYNPSTWLLVRQVLATENKFDYRKSKVPPEYLVYEQTLIKDLDALRPLQGQRTVNRRKNRVMKNLFRYYPLNYDRNGELRAHPHMPPDELEEWMSQVKKSNPIAKKEEDTKDVVVGDHATEEVAEDDSPEAAAIHEIMKMLDDTDTVPNSRVAELEEELDKTKKESLEADIRADIAEKKVTAMTAKYQTAVQRFSVQVGEALCEYKEQSHKLLCQERTNLSTLKNILEKKEDEITSLQSDLKKSDKDVLTAKQETKVAKQQIFKILEEMKKKKQGTGVQKKRVEEDGAEAARKKPKIESCEMQ